jgi:hypothetical protein
MNPRVEKLPKWKNYPVPFFASVKDGIPDFWWTRSWRAILSPYSTDWSGRLRLGGGAAARYQESRRGKFSLTGMCFPYILG